MPATVLPTPPALPGNQDGGKTPRKPTRSATEPMVMA
jgi:hypothetical protein